MAEWVDAGRLLAARLRRAWFGLGLRATAKAVVWRVCRLDPEVSRKPIDLPHGPNPFDAQYEVETGGFVGWRQLYSGQSSDAYISGYFGTVPSIGRRLIGTVQDTEDYTFVDVGCGKGRVLILASEAKFRRIVGVEISAALATVARENAAVVASRFPERTPIEVVHADAAQFEWPTGSLVVFLYQPFERPVMRALLDRLTASLEATPRPMALIYLNPTLASMVDGVALLERREAGRSVPEAAERPYSYGGRGDGDAFVIWGTRAHPPRLHAAAE